MKFSSFGQRYSRQSGISQLMEDLGHAMAGEENILMLGGGNPAHIPEVQTFIQDRIQRLAENPAELAHVIGNYDPPKGESHFIEALVDLFREQYDWKLGPENIVLTAGSQSAFFLLFNMFAGDFEDGSHKQILFPLAPEYIGYSDVALSENCFAANKPEIETFPDRTFKYHVDFDTLTIGDNVGAICVSRPTNPTGNVLTDEEMHKLSGLAEKHGIPFIVDNAYGMPFPNIIFTEANLVWNDNIILCMSLSKVGLPGARTGIVIANEEVIDAIARMNAIFSLALGSFGPALGYDLIKSGEILRLSNNIIKPYYERKAKFAADIFKTELEGVDYYIHKTEGALFLWLWFPGLPITSDELYQRLKDRGVLILSGHYFFPGLEEDWAHKNECIRVSYAMGDEVVREGIKVISEEVKQAFSQ